MLGENNYSSYEVDGTSKGPCGVSRIPDFEAHYAKARPVVSSFEQEIARAFALSDQLKLSIDELCARLRVGQNVQLAPVRNLLQACAESVESNVFSWLFLCQIKNPQSYLVEHAFRTAALAMALGSRLSMRDHEIVELGLAAMLSDVGKIMIPNSILEKEGALSSAEYAVIRVHPLEGRKILLSHTDASSALIDVVVSHHEQVDGNGYPANLFGENIPYFARIVAIADAFDAMTSERSYAPARSVADAQKILWGCRDKQFDASLVEVFLSMLGVFPPGTEVRLSDGSSAVVLEPVEGKTAEMKVILTQDTSAMHIDVASTDADQPNKRYIASSEPGVPHSTTQHELRNVLQCQNASFAADSQSNN